MGHLEPHADQGNVRLPGHDAARRLLLKRMKDIDGALEANGVDRSVSVAVIVLDDLENPHPFASPRLGGKVLSSVLRGAEGESDASLDVGWKLSELLQS